MALRAFRTAFLVAIDPDEIVQVEEDGTANHEPTVEDVKDFLNNALAVEVDEGYAALDIGFCSAEVTVDDLVELSQEEVDRLYPSSTNNRRRVACKELHEALRTLATASAKARGTALTKANAAIDKWKHLCE